MNGKTRVHFRTHRAENGIVPGGARFNSQAFDYRRPTTSVETFPAVTTANAEDGTAEAVVVVCIASATGTLRLYLPADLAEQIGREGAEAREKLIDYHGARRLDGPTRVI